MAKKKGHARPVTKEDRELVRDLTGQILAAIKDQGLTREQVAQRAGRKSASTLYGWRNGDSERPSLLDLQDYARAVGLSVGLFPHDAVDAAGGGSRNGGGAKLKPETAEVVRLMNNLPEDARVAIRDAALAVVEKIVANPPDADAEQPGPHARSK